MKQFVLPVLLQLAGVAIIIAEIILPSGGLLSVLALGAFGASLYIVFNTISSGAGIAFAAVDLVTIPVLVVVGLKMLARSPVTLRTELKSSQGVTSQSPELSRYLGQQGRALCDLRPAGTALINGKRLDVVSRGEYIEKDADLLVIQVTANQIIVRQQEQ